MHDTIIRGGTVIDGTGAPGFSADVAIRNGRIAEIGKIATSARAEIDADGAIVTPGFVDVHTHYDGQFLWDDRLDPSFSHGVTTAIGGNCGVGFAPLRAELRKPLMELMEGVEEIPEIVLDEGLDWNWRSFPDYLDRLDARHYTMDIASQITHAPLRVFVMGERALNHAAATADDIAAMSALVEQAMAAGAAGFSCARLLEHFSSTGGHVPGTFAADEEFLALATAMGRAGHGVFQYMPRGANGDLMFPDEGDAPRREEHARMVRIARACGRPVTYNLLQFASRPDDWRMMLDLAEASLAGGDAIHPQIHTRGVGALTTLDGYHVFLMRAAYHEVAHLPLPERLAALREPARRAAILAQQPDPELAAANPQLAGFLAMLQGRIANVFPMDASLDYEPTEARRLGSLAAAAGVTQEEYLYDHYTGGDGTNVCASFALNYAGGNYDPIATLLAHPGVISGLGDGGAHMRMACDGALPTFQLTFWARDRQRGPRLPLEHVVHKLSGANAALYGMQDRGTLAVGKRADVNVIDHAALRLNLPRMTFDLPSGAGRLLQTSTGYLATLVAGEVTRRHDADTGARPGRLVRFR
ncbi:MAG: amidohydrolase family protein [Sphingomonadales bacterium]|nr:amidohydrolase family protein [Sphingomonadales bacterium]